MTPSPPKFVVDRCLAKRVPAGLAANGWEVILIQDVFPHEAQDISDEQWLTWGNTHADAALTKDEAIRRSPWYTAAEMPIFCLSRQDLAMDEMLALFLHQAKRIHRIAASHPGRQFWVLYRDGTMTRSLDRS